MAKEIKTIELEDEDAENNSDTINYAEFTKPPKDLKESQDMVESAIQRFKRRKVELSEEEKADLEMELAEQVNDWEDSRVGLETKLRDLNDLYEGVTEETDYPWPGSSNIKIPLEKIKGREIVSVINRTTMRPIPFAVTTYAGPDSLYEENKNFVKDLESFAEDKLKNATNIHETLKMCLPSIYRDGTSIPQVMWETEYERVSDYKLYDKALDFVEDYPDSESAGISVDKWQNIVDKLSQGEKYEIRYEYDVPTYDDPKAYQVPLIDLFHWPVYVPEMKDLITYGKRVYYTDYQLKMKSSLGLFKKEDVESVVKGGGDERENDWETSRDRIEGLNRSTSRKKAQEHEFFELVYKGALTEKDKEDNVFRKYLVYFYKKTGKVFHVEHYPIRKGKINFFPLRFIKRDGRLLGVSLLDDIADLCLDIDIQNRQIINSRTITHVPSFKAKMSAKSTFDPSRREFRFRPGVTFYMTDVNDVTQFDIRPVDLSGSQDNILFFMQLVDMVTGSTSGFSGQANPIDPRAPARKQQELLRQSSNRIDDYVQALLPVFSEIVQFMIDLYYQYAPERIKYFSKTEDGKLIEKEIERTKLYNPHCKFRINGSSVFMNADQEFDRALEIDTLVNSRPITAQNPRILKASWERVLMASRIQDEKSLIPSDQEMPEALTNSLDREIEAKAAQNKERMQTRALGDQAKRQHEKEMALIEAVSSTVPEIPQETQTGGVNAA